MDRISQTAQDGRTGKKRERKPSKRQPSSAGKEKVTFYLTKEAVQRVGITATMEEKSHSTIVEELINSHLRKWVVSCRGIRSEAIHDDVGAGEGLADSQE